MGSAETNDLNRLQQLAFRRSEKCGDLVKSFYRLSAKKRRDPDHALLTKVYAWLFVPYSLWPIDIDGLLRFMLSSMNGGENFDDQIRFLVNLLDEVPEPKAQEAVRTHEFLVQQGQYEPMVKSLHKYEEIAQALIENPQLRKEWNEIKRVFEVNQYANRRGVIQRRMVQERNFRPEWNFKWGRKDQQFKNVFDAFCCRWDLYGMENDKPLLLKFSLNVTAYGTMMMVPRYWSLDGHRDLRWKTIAKLHRARGVLRQGPKMSENRIANRQDAAKARELWEQATRDGIRGSKRELWVMNQMGWRPHTDPSKLKRLLGRKRN